MNFLIAALLAVLCTCAEADIKTKKNIGIFNVVKFGNSPCDSTDTKNGTCYTSEECENLSGKSSGTCADGYGVCCVFTSGCGDTTSQNGTYFESSGSPTGACNLKVCPCQNDICQIRLDFMTFVIAGPSTLSETVGAIFGGEGIPDDTADAVAKGLPVSAATQCSDDQFTVTNPGGPAPPVICGTNTNAHMYVDASAACNTLSFQLSAGTVSVTRQWAIKVSQYSCDFGNKAPSGCVQYFTGTSGVITTFNWANKVHLANQAQKVCVRRERNQCTICYSAADADFRISGMENNMAVIAKCGTLGFAAMAAGSNTNIDRVVIPGALKDQANAFAALAAHDDAFCGARLGSAVGASATICSKRLPFEISFNSDNYEFGTEYDAADPMQNHQGFSIDFKQFAC